MSTYTITHEYENENVIVLRLAFGTPATNAEIVKDATAAAKAIASKVFGKLVALNGPVSAAAAIAIGHVLVHVAPAIAVFDPKMNAYVIAVTHDYRWRLGDTIPADEIENV